MADAVHPIFAKKGSRTGGAVARFVHAIGGEADDGPAAGDNAILAQFRSMVHGMWEEGA